MKQKFVIKPRYLVTCETYSPFFTNYFDAENHFNADVEMIVYDLMQGKYTSDGKTWNEISIDHL